MSSSDQLTNLEREINHLGFVSGEQISLLAHFTKNVEKITIAVSCLDDFDEDEDKRAYLRSLISMSEQPGATVQIRARSFSPPESDINVKRRKHEKEYKDTVACGLEATVGSKPPEVFKSQKSCPILDGRPIEYTGPPITLYNIVFIQFLDDFSDANIQIPSDFLLWVKNLIYAATDIYGDEEERNQKMRKMFSDQLGTVSLIECGGGRMKCKSDGMFTSTTIIDLATAYLGIFAGKNEIGTGGRDPTIQGAMYFRDYWSQSNVDKIRECCCAPSFIIAITGPWVCILGAVFLNRVVVQPLTDFIPLTINLRISDQFNRIARLFYALLLAFRRLQYFYQNLNLNPSDQRVFPYIREFLLNDVRVSFTYISELSDDYTRTIWKAKTDDNRIIVIKFVPKYNFEAHNICANNDYAPKLLYHSNDEEAKRLGGLKMVIMDYIDSISLDQKRGINTEFWETIFNDVEAAIQVLHKNNFVFADLRAPNILIVNATQHAMLIDFDWCGKHDVDKYPPSMNKNLSWPSGAEPCALLRKEHDIYWLNVLRDLKPSDFN